MQISRDLAKSVMIDAVESGIGYWFIEHAENPVWDKVGFNDTIPSEDWEYRSVKFKCSDATDDGRECEVSIDLMMEKFDDFSIAFPVTAGNIASEDYDAIDADVFFQFVAFGEVVYG